MQGAAAMNPSGQECYSIERISENVQCIRETDEWDCRPLMYLIVGDEKALLIDTGCGSGDLNKFIRSSGVISEKQKLIVLNTHNHPEQTGGNWSFSSAGKMGLSHNVENLCASGADKNYTKLRCEHYDWQVKAFKITRWLADEETILLGDSSELRNVVKVMHAPGHTPDSMILWYENDRRLFIGCIFYEFADILLISEWSSIKEYEESVRSLVAFVAQQEERHSAVLHYSSAKSQCNNRCTPTLKNFHRFLLAVLAGMHQGTPLRIDEYEGSRYETRDKAVRLVLSRRIVEQLEEAKRKVYKR